MATTLQFCSHEPQDLRRLNRDNAFIWCSVCGTIGRIRGYGRHRKIIWRSPQFTRIHAQHPKDVNLKDILCFGTITEKIWEQILDLPLDPQQKLLLQALRRYCRQYRQFPIIEEARQIMPCFKSFSKINAELRRAHIPYKIKKGNTNIAIETTSI